MARKLGEDIQNKMKELKEMGLTNSQIAIELGINRVTVRKYLGETKSWARSSYGTIIAHSSGASYIPKNEKENKELHLLSDVKTFEGKFFIYRLDMRNNTVCMDFNYETYGNKISFQNFTRVIGELAQIQRLIVSGAPTDIERINGR